MKGNNIFYVTLCTMLIIVVTAVLDSVVMRNVLITNGHGTLVREAENMGERIDEWLISNMGGTI